MHADLLQTIDKSWQGIRRERRGQHHNVRGAKIERLVPWLGTRARMLLQKLIHDADHPAAQTFNRSEFPHVDAGQLFRQYRLVTGGKAPVREVVGKSLPDKVVILQGTERVLEDGIVGAGLQRLPQLAERRSLLPSDAQQVFRGVE